MLKKFTNTKTTFNPNQELGLKQIWNLTFPQILMTIFHFGIGFTDVVVAGRISPDVQAVIGIVTQCQFVLIVIATALANASVASISQAIGARLNLRAIRYTGLSLGLGLVFCLLVLPVAIIFQQTFLNLLHVSDQLMPTTKNFWQIYLLALPAHYLLVLSNAVFRAYKAVYLPLITTFIVFLINAFLDLGFGLGWFGLPAFGANAIAWASLISVFAGAVFNFVMLIKLQLFKSESIASWRWNKAALPYLIKVAIPSAGMQLLWQIGYLVLIGITNALPKNSETAMAGMTAGMRVESMLFMPALAFNLTGAVLIGNCLGAGKKLEAKRVGLKILGLGCGTMSSFAAILWFFVPTIAAFVAPDPAVMQECMNYLKFNILSTPFTVASMILTGLLSGAGATIYPFYANSFSIWCVRLPLAYIMGHIIWKNASGVFFAMLISQMVQSSLCLYIFLFKNWTRFAQRGGNKTT
ncbi:MATE family efflux transporter [Desulfovibrio litoralis]|uniref:Multidrug-efflux transporter n=1 Tax=Desulfovibrio litoralis DSM 11393 TaxID=1121455 RepID=A0A1M7SQ70_9BACT|nr:MATE family efflux transporter [Desulfovibrio litoralis]SHN60564.1 multidrug resistance protein, MATE family [Desulfovibrio litoralis DSM 11393]